jgi:hypothetical protein
MDLDTTKGGSMWASHAVERLDGGQLVDQERGDQWRGACAVKMDGRISFQLLPKKSKSQKKKKVRETEGKREMAWQRKGRGGREKRELTPPEGATRGPHTPTERLDVNQFLMVLK